MDDFSHFNASGRARMVDVSDKQATCREAKAFAQVFVNESTFELIRTGGSKKGDVLAAAQIAGIMAAKRTWELIPMCHPIALTGTDLELCLDSEKLCVDITATVRCTGPTGVEMEALTAASVAALTVYDMCKAVQRDIVIGQICLLEKSGGVSGHFVRENK